MEKLCMKFSVLNVDFDGPSFNFLGSRKPAHEGIKEAWACCLSQQALLTSSSVVSTSMTLKNLNFQNKGFLLIFAIFGCSAHSKNEL